VSVPTYAPALRHAYYKFPVLLSEDIDRDRLRRALEEEFRIENGTLYDPPCHLQPALRSVLGLGEGAFPIAEHTLARQVCPPMHSELSRDEVSRVALTMRALVDRCHHGMSSGS
jgi:perosamine synthetase